MDRTWVDHSPLRAIGLLTIHRECLNVDNRQPKDFGGRTDLPRTTPNALDGMEGAR